MHQLPDRLRSLLRSALQDDVMGLGAELAYRFLFALFPFMIFLSALGGYVASWLGVADPTTQVIEAVSGDLPPELVATIRPQLEAVLGSTSPALLSFGAIAALWAATGGTNALIKAMNRAYGVQDTRGFVGRYVVAVALTLLAVGGIIASFLAIAGGAVVTAELVQPLGVGSVLWTAIEVLRYPVVLALLVAAVAVLYRLAPARRAPWRWSLLGAAVFAVGWLVATAGFSLYLASFGSYASTYGAIAGVIVLMLWLYLTSLVLLVGAEVVASGAGLRAADQSLATAQGGSLGAAAAAPAAGGAEPSEAGSAPVVVAPRETRQAAPSAPPLRRPRARWPIVVPLSLVGVAVAVGAFLGAASERLLSRDE